MTSTESSTDPFPSDGELRLTVNRLEEGNALIEVFWESRSPWVPAGRLRLSTHDERIILMTSGQVVEAVIRQLRAVMQSMIGEVWPRP